MNSTVLAVCGWKNSGKTTLVEELLPVLRRKGLAVSVIKHDCHGIDVDRPGKDSHRFFAAGADVALQGAGEVMVRFRREEGLRPAGEGPGPADEGLRLAGEEPDSAEKGLRPASRPAENAGHEGTGRGTGKDAAAPRTASPFVEKGSLGDLLDHLVPRCDLVLVEGHKATPLPKIWLEKREGPGRPESVRNVLLELPPGPGRLEAAADFIEEWLHSAWREAPLLGCLLVGGGSRRMGRPKHLIASGGETWGERIAALLEEAAGEVVVAGAGSLPPSMESLVRLPDVPGAGGPLAGILAAMRWRPEAAWLVAACDMPAITPEALEWLKERRRPGIWATLPFLPAAGTGPGGGESPLSEGESGGGAEPLLALYDMRSRPLLEALVRAGDFSLQRLPPHPKVETPRPPRDLAPAWKNYNSAAELGR